MNLKTAFIFALLFCAFSVHAAELTINGTVLEKGTRNPLQGVVVSVQDQAVLSAVSDAKGHFQINLPAAGSYVLMASNSGFTATLAVQLAEDKPLPAPTFYLRVPETLGEMVVTAERSPDQVSKNVHTVATAVEDLKGVWRLSRSFWFRSDEVPLGDVARPAEQVSVPEKNAHLCPS